MAKQNPLALLTLLAVAAVFAFWLASGAGDEPMPVSPPVREQGDPRIVEHAGGEVATTASEAKREVVEDQPPTATEPAPAYAFSLTVRLIDELGMPVEGGNVRFAPIGCTRNVESESTDADGRVTLRWGGREPSVRMAIGAPDCAPREVLVTAATDRELVLLSPRYGGGQRIRLVSSSGGNSGSFQMTIDNASEDTALGFTNADRTVQSDRRLNEHSTFADLLLDEATAEHQVHILNGLHLGSYATISSFRVTFSPNVYQGPDANQFGTVRGTVFGEDGNPVINQVVCIGPSPDRSTQQTRSGEDGTFAFENQPIGPAEIRAGGGPQGLGRTTVLVVARGTTAANVNLRREQCIEGTAISDGGKPLEDWYVEYEALDGSWVDRTRTRDGGKFLLANLPGGPGRLLLRQDAHRVPAAVVPSVLPNSGPVAFDLASDRAPNGGIVVRVPSAPKPSETPVANESEPAPPEQTPPAAPSSAPVELLSSDDSMRALTLDASGFLTSGILLERVQAGASSTTTSPTGITVYAWQQESRLGFTIPRGEDGAFACGRLPAGYYRIEFHDVGSGWVDLGTHWVDGKGVLDLGTVARPPTARLVLENCKPEMTVELYHRRAYGDVRAARDLAGRRDLALPPGSWRVLWRTGEEEIHAREFVLQPGTTTVVDLAK